MEEITTERLLILLLLFCMGGRYLLARIDGHSVELRSGERSSDEDDE